MELIFTHLPNLLLIFCRMAGFFIVAPFFSTHRGVPSQIRIGLAVAVALLVFTATGTEPAIVMSNDYVYYVLRESLIGVLLGFIAYLFFTVVQIAGSFIDMQMGLGIANVIDPMTGAQNPVFGSFKFMIAMLLFLSLDAHHYLLLGIMDSYESIPLDNSFFTIVASGTPTELLTRSLATAFSLSFQMAAPIVAAMFLVDVALGILAKTAPQFNVFVIGMPLKLLVGLAITILLIPGFLAIFQTLFITMFEQMFEMMRTLRTVGSP